MKKVTFLLTVMLASFSISLLAQTTIVFQSFEGSDTWNYTPDPSPFNSGGDVWDVVNNTFHSFGTIPSDGTQFWGIQDLNCPAGTPNWGTLTFTSVDISSYTDVTITFDYEVDGFDTGDDMKYEVFYDGVGQGEVLFVDGYSNLDQDGTININVPNNINSIYLIVSVKQNGGSDYGGLDNFIVSGTSGGPSPLDAEFSADNTSVPTGTTVNFTDLTTGGTPPYTYSWDLDGDGFEDETTQNPSFTYNTPGTYTVELTVTDDVPDTDTETKVDYITVVDVATGMIINEVDADTPSTDADEFIELYDGGTGNTDLTGLVVVLFNGYGDVSYNAFDLDGQSTDANGYFVMGSANVPNVDMVIGTTNIIQNGADAVALYEGNNSDFPNGTPVTTSNLLDALVYDTNDGDDTGLLVLLNAGQPQVNEGGRGNSAVHSNQRIPNGSGGQRNTYTYDQSPPTPGAVNVLLFTDWTGQLSSNWEEVGNWHNGIPNAGLGATIPDVSKAPFPIITGSATCNSLYIYAGASLEIATTGALTVNGTLTNNGTLTIKSDASGTGSLIESSGVNATVERYFTGNDTDWHLVSSSISNATANTFLGMYLQSFSEATNSYTDIIDPSTVLNVMEGYAVYSTLGTANTVTFVGTLNFGTQNNTYDSTLTGWNLFGNPYASSIDWDAVTIPASLNGEVHYIRASDGNDLFYNNGGTGSRYIPPMQGFFVKAKPTAPGTLTFDNTVRTHLGANIFYKADDPQLLILKAASENYSDETWIRFNEEAGIEHDGNYDAYKRISLSNPELPQIFSYTPSDIKLGLNTLPETEMVPVGFTAVESGVFTISAIETGEFTVVILEDLFTQTQIDLLSNSYTFTYTEGDDEARFIVHFTPIVAAGENAEEIFNIYSFGDEVYVSVPENTKGNIVIYNIIGQEVINAPINNVLNKITLEKSAYYIVKVLSDESMVTKKVFIK